MNQIIAAFDFDGTLTGKDTLVAFLRHTHKPVRRIANLLFVFPFILLYKLGLMNNGKAKQKLFSVFYRNWNIEKFTGYCESFSTVIDKCIRSDVYQKMKNHLSKGHKVLIVSASIDNWIIPWTKKEGIDAVIATQIEVSLQGFLTGRFLTPNCFGEEKVRRLLNHFPDRDSYTLIVYGDSKGDAELLKMADEKHVILSNHKLS